MDQKERSADFTAGLKLALAGWQRGIWTALPGIVQDYDASDNTVSVQPSIKATVLNVDTKTGKQTPQDVNLPLLIKVPVHQIGGGGYVLDFQPAEGDEVLVVFSSRNIDGWWQNGGIQSQVEKRAHDLSDGIAIPGLFSAARANGKALGGGGARIRALDGSASMIMNSGTITFNATTFVFNGNIQSTGTITNNTHRIDSTHEHTNTQPGGGVSGPPV